MKYCQLKTVQKKYFQLITMLSTSSTITNNIMKRIVILTGASDGIGKAAVHHLVKANCHVILACRSKEKAELVMQQVRENYTDASMEFAKLDLADLESVSQFSKNFLQRNIPLHSLICNAGVWTDNQRKTTVQGWELTYGTNHLGHFVLVNLLLNKLRETLSSRVLIVSSGLHPKGNVKQLLKDPNYESGKFSGKTAYCNSKLANVLFGYGLANRLAEMNGQSSNSNGKVSVMVWEPGVVRTSLFDEAFGFLAYPIGALFFQKPEKASEPEVHYAIDFEHPVEGMKYFAQWKEKESCTDSYNKTYQDELWNMSLEQTRKYLDM